MCPGFTPNGVTMLPCYAAGNGIVSMLLCYDIVLCYHDMEKKITLGGIKPTISYGMNVVHYQYAIEFRSKRYRTYYSRRDVLRFRFYLCCIWSRLAISN